VVRQRSAEPRFPGSIPGAASKSLALAMIKRGRGDGETRGHGEKTNSDMGTGDRGKDQIKETWRHGGRRAGSFNIE
jgi:hypothetical protein